MNLIGQTKILTDCGRYETCLKFWIAHFPKFTTLLKIWLLTKLLFPSKGRWFSNSTYQRNTSILASKFSNFVIRLDTRDMKVYLGKDRQRTAQHMTAAHATVTTDKEDRRMWPQFIHGQFLFFPWISDDLANKQIYCCGTVRPNRRGTPQDLRPKTTKLKRGDIHVRTRADLTAILWRDKRHMHFFFSSVFPCII